jgi:oxygen-independent coproporphyrinogen-3 oxidase
VSGTENIDAAGLYLHIPFCSRKCGYCDFFSVPDAGLIPRFLEALHREIDLYRGEFTGFDTIYLGGGTPSLLSIRQLETLLEKIRQSFDILPDPEITIETNPADLGRQELEVLKGLGFNRISIGIQSFHDRDLGFLGRRHTGAQAVQALEDALAARLGNIGIDLMYGLPGQTRDAWESNLMKAVGFQPAHLSCYELEIKAGTPLGNRYEKSEFHRLPEETQRGLFMMTSEVLESHGYTHYEVSNFARDMDRASRHNRKYWDHTPYLGLGPSAHSFRDRRRWWNHTSLGDYLRDLNEGKRPVCDCETLDSGQMRMEAVFLGLRTKQGIDLERFRLRYGGDLLAEKGAVLAEWQSTGLVEIRDGFIRPTLSGMAVADSLVLF